jgi:hypothetical protein
MDDIIAANLDAAAPSSFDIIIPSLFVVVIAPKN